MARLSPIVAILLVLIPVGAFGQGVTAEGIPDRTTIMTEEDFQDAARRGIDLPAALEDGILGIRVRGGGLSGLSNEWCVEYRPNRLLSGGGCRGVAVYVDGVRIADPGSFFTFQPVDDIVRAEVLSAVDATTRYGAAATLGAVLIETRTGQAGPPSANSIASLDWSLLEREPYPWGRVLGSTFLANAAGAGIGLLLTNRCSGEATSFAAAHPCNLPSSVGSRVVGLALPTLAGSFAARWAGTTDRSRGRLIPAAILGSITVAAGSFLLVDEGVSSGNDTGKIVGALLLTVATPVVITLSNRIFRVLR